MYKPKVSILIPCYNCEKWIAETLQSVLNQTWKNTEVILVDDGSTDNTLAIAKTYESKSIKVISQPNKGASAARNTALKESQGDFIQYLDADDLLSPDKIELQIKLVEQGYESYVIAGEWGRFYTSPLEADFIKEAVWQDMSPIDWLVCSWEGGGMMHPAAWLVPRSLISLSGYWNENLCLNDDGEYFCRVLLASQGVKYCAGAKCYYRSGLPNSLSGLRSHQAVESLLLSLEICSNYLIEKENSLKTRHACATSFQRFIYSNYPYFPDLVSKAEEKVAFFGGSDLKISGGKGFSFISDIIGWKLAKRLQIAINYLNKSH